MKNPLKSWIGALGLPLILSLGWSPGVAATVAVNNLFKNNCVLQRDKPVNIWGTGASGENVTVTFTRGATTQTKTATTAADGTWKVVLDPISGSFTAGTLTVNTIPITGVLVGEVWLASGQSNMQYSFADVTTPADPAADTNMRYFHIATANSATPLTNYSATINWSSTTTYMSLVAYYFMKDVKDHQNVPVGWIQAPFSGTPIRTWISQPALESTTLGHDIIANYTGSQTQQAPFRTYNAMINPVFPYTVRGVIWYQGENDVIVPAPENYKTLFPLLINSWRASFGQGNIPFYYVQIAGFNTSDGYYAGVREAQAQTLAVSNTGMVTILDIGDTGQIHPPDKDIVGQRLARLAKRRIFQDLTVVDQGPKFDHAVFQADGKVRVYFTNTGSGLTGAADLKGFSLAGADGVYANALLSTYHAYIQADGVSVLVSNSTVPAPQFVRYEWENRCAGITLRNEAGLCAPPFRASVTEPNGPPAGDLTNFRWGPGAQTGAAALGVAGDTWPSSTLSQNPTTPLPLVNTLGVPTGVSLTWQNGTGGQPGSLTTGQTSQYWSPYDAATSTLMTSYLKAYHYTNNTGAILLTLNGLTPSADYDVILYAAGLNPGATYFNITGTGVSPVSASGATRRISDGEGVAFAAETVTTSATGTLTIRTANSGSWIYVNGFQLRAHF